MFFKNNQPRTFAPCPSVRGERPRRDEPRGEGRRSDSRALVVSRFRDDLSEPRRSLPRTIPRKRRRRVPLSSSEGAWSAASLPPRHSSSPPRASGLRVRCRASASARTRRLGARRARRRSRRSRAPPPRLLRAALLLALAVSRRWRRPPGSAAARPRASLPPGDTAARLRPTTPSPRRAARRRATGTRPRARRSSPPLALASVPSFGATRRLLSRRIRIRLSPPPRAPRRRPARRYRSTAPWRRSGSRTSRVT